MNDSVNQEKIYHLSCTDRYRFSHFRGVTGPVTRSMRRNSISSLPLVLVLRDKQVITFENTEKMHRVYNYREALRTSLRLLASCFVSFPPHSKWENDIHAPVW